VRRLIVTFGVACALGLGGCGGGDGDDNAQALPSAEDVARSLREGDVLLGPREAPFAMRYPDSWRPLPQRRLRQADPPPIAGLERRDGTGIITVAVRGPVRGGIRSLVGRLPAELRRRYADFELQEQREVRVAAGRALYTSWVRSRSGIVQSNLVVPVSNRRSYSVDGVLRGGASRTARETGTMLRTFDLPDG